MTLPLPAPPLYVTFIEWTGWCWRQMLTVQDSGLASAVSCSSSSKKSPAPPPPKNPAPPPIPWLQPTPSVQCPALRPSVCQAHQHSSILQASLSPGFSFITSSLSLPSPLCNIYKKKHQYILHVMFYSVAVVCKGSGQIGNQSEKMKARFG